MRSAWRCSTVSDFPSYRQISGTSDHRIDPHPVEGLREISTSTAMSGGGVFGEVEVVFAADPGLAGDPVALVGFEPLLAELLAEGRRAAAADRDVELLGEGLDQPADQGLRPFVTR